MDGHQGSFLFGKPEDEEQADNSSEYREPAGGFQVVVIAGFFFDEGFINVVYGNGGTGIDQGVDGGHEGGGEGGDNDAKNPGVLFEGFPDDDDEGVVGIFDFDEVVAGKDGAKGGLFGDDGFGDPADGADDDSGDG